MAISPTAQWEIRTTGSDTNGGMYVSGAGIDYSQQDAAQLSLSDVVTNGTTTVTSATGGFTANMVNNGINIAGTVYQITARTDTNTITVDRTVGAASGQTGKVGGALASPGYASGQGVNQNRFWIKSGTYTLTSSTQNIAGGKVVSPAGVAGVGGAPCVWEGYQAARGDKGTKPVINDGVLTGISMFATSSFSTYFDNIEFVVSSATNIGLAIGHNLGRGLRIKTSGVGIGIDFVSSTCLLYKCLGLNTTNTPFNIRTSSSRIVGCVAIGSGTDGFKITVSGNQFHRCLAISNGGHGFNNGTALTNDFTGCVAYGNAGDGFMISTSFSTGVACMNCLAVGNGGLGFNIVSAGIFFALISCAGYNNAGGNVASAILNIEGFITLTANPFTNAAGLDFTLNNVAGGGAALRAAGAIPSFPGLATDSFLDIGAAQHRDSAGADSPGITTLLTRVTAPVVLAGVAPSWYAPTGSNTIFIGASASTPTELALRVGDAGVTLQETLRALDGTPLNLAGKTITLSLIPQAGGSALWIHDAIVAWEGGGVAEYTFAADDLATAGAYYRRWTISSPGIIQSYPEDQNLPVLIQA